MKPTFVSLAEVYVVSSGVTVKAGGTAVFKRGRGRRRAPTLPAASVKVTLKVTVPLPKGVLPLALETRLMPVTTCVAEVIVAAARDAACRRLCCDRVVVRRSDFGAAEGKSRARGRQGVESGEFRRYGISGWRRCVDDDVLGCQAVGARGRQGQHGRVARRVLDAAAIERQGGGRGIVQVRRVLPRGNGVVERERRGAAAADVVGHRPSLSVSCGVPVTVTAPPKVIVIGIVVPAA